MKTINRERSFAIVDSLEELNVISLITGKAYSSKVVPSLLSSNGLAIRHTIKCENEWEVYYYEHQKEESK